VAGDFDKKQLLAKVKAAFSDWPKGEPVADPPAVPFEPKPGVFVVEKDLPQATVRMGHLGVLKKDPDVFALEVMDFILGGSGFTSRMMRELRSNRGLAYSVGSYFSAGQERGSFGMYCDTKSKTTLQAIDAMKEIFCKMTEAPVAEEELTIARDSIRNSFVFQFQSAGQIVSQAIALEYEGLPPDYLELYNEAIGKVTAQEVMDVAKRHLLPDKLTIVVVGKQAAFDKPLSTLGPVEVIPPEEFGK
jgi:predicted Zn-dependent peptidase